MIFVFMDLSGELGRTATLIFIVVTPLMLGTVPVVVAGDGNKDARAQYRDQQPGGQHPYQRSFLNVCSFDFLSGCARTSVSVPGTEDCGDKQRNDLSDDSVAASRANTCLYFVRRPQYYCSVP
ncbi:hypothetical protein R69608_07879 [Paraburkholderia nemoris]|uniref:Uncharacterized protein n=1 Tax=Paraburkholderia nemoris TaxID=2793076 RepID=A0ABM8T7M2_9BURK|nr:hypothetical protein R69619_07834 [Paraburkholderia nemoris]CAE6861015.1 hypothetical protein R75777_08037 [Paraburkholderia nemoris]CAE6863889.1 hypothetical protein R69776_08152 [Paraburkholderia nemoris]CAE6972836.1 hypothetical protein R69608_07879 [Paraburkholderia nemoris]